jgi:hypothetical protein
MDGFICASPSEHTQPDYSPSKVHNPTSIIPLVKSVRFEDSLGAHWRIGKAIDNVKIQLDEPMDYKTVGYFSCKMLGIDFGCIMK